MEAPANTFALGLTASPDALNTLEVRSNGLYSSAPTWAQYDALVARVAALRRPPLRGHAAAGVRAADHGGAGPRRPAAPPP